MAGLEFQECDVCPEMVVLPLGGFVMGGVPSEIQSRAMFAFSEGPRHTVEIDRRVALGKNEVTYEEWDACVEDGGCNGYRPRRSFRRPISDHEAITYYFVADHPVVYVSYNDAVSYVSWLNSKVGGDDYRLPTEAEWEFAIRAGSDTLYSRGVELNTDQANFMGTSTEVVFRENRPDLLSRGVPVLVHEMPEATNAWGLRHMEGNVAEWTTSCWSSLHQEWATSSEHLSMSRSDGECDRLAAESGYPKGYRVIRGGHFATSMYMASSAHRSPGRADTRLQYIGFRIARDMDPAQE